MVWLTFGPSVSTIDPQVFAPLFPICTTVVSIPKLLRIARSLVKVLCTALSKTKLAELIPSIGFVKRDEPHRMIMPCLGVCCSPLQHGCYTLLGIYSISRNVLADEVNILVPTSPIRSTIVHVVASFSCQLFFIESATGSGTTSHRCTLGHQENLRKYVVYEAEILVHIGHCLDEHGKVGIASFREGKPHVGFSDAVLVSQVIRPTFTTSRAYHPHQVGGFQRSSSDKVERRRDYEVRHGRRVILVTQPQVSCPCLGNAASLLLALVKPRHELQPLFMVFSGTIVDENSEPGIDACVDAHFKRVSRVA
jgi:hypothetical protein